MALQLFNTLTRRTEEFVPLNPPHVGMYTCGPTVWNYAHIGNLRAFLSQDLLRRYLEYKGYDVKHVMNITDVEDKIIRSVRESGKSLREMTDFYTQEFFRDLDALNIKRAHVTPRATDTIPDMIKLIETLIAKKHAYVAEDGSVYFSIKSFKDYGKLAHLDFDNLQFGVRVQHDEYDKEHVADFALWKAWDEDDGDVKWDSPWGPGRPGWHIECSVMSMKHLGETFDIHCGGEDLIFPHHEDEIAQSEAATGKPFARFWFHNAHLLVEGKKMSKSLGNFYTLRDLLQKGWSGREIRYALISAHYREQLNFTFDGLQAARSALQRIDGFLLKLQEIAQSASPNDFDKPLKAGLQFLNAMDDDLNISGALGVLFDFIRFVHKEITAGCLRPSEAGAILEEWEEIDKMLGLGMPAKSTIPAEVQALVEERQAARKAKNFKRSDEIRDQLAKLGWTIEDTPQGSRAKRT
ncbi:MAG TPA: cysteine--tRNA ligase [Verrucomicrobiae bacterium]|nr:cysteine--tRNA ligase [Verrucomicrobiae bacterium]